MVFFFFLVFLCPFIPGEFPFYIQLFLHGLLRVYSLNDLFLKFCRQNFYEVLDHLLYLSRDPCLKTYNNFNLTRFQVNLTILKSYNFHSGYHWCFFYDFWFCKMMFFNLLVFCHYLLLVFRYTVYHLYTVLPSSKRNSH